ncbi:hypothetical protein [Streptomyces deserti]
MLGRAGGLAARNPGGLGLLARIDERPARQRTISRQVFLSAARDGLWPAWRPPGDDLAGGGHRSGTTARPPRRAHGAGPRGERLVTADRAARDGLSPPG